MGLELSPELQRRADAVIAKPNYRGPDLSEKVAIGLEGPFGVGKSTVTEKDIERLAKIGIRAGLIGSQMTRSRRPSDPANYTTDVEPEELIARGENGELINLSQSTTGHLYATSFEGVPYDVNIGPLLPSAMQKFQEARFGIVKAFYLTTTPEQWQKQLDRDKRLSQPDAAQRIIEAERSLEYVMNKLAHPEIGSVPLTIIHNDGSRSVEELAGHILYAAGYLEFKSDAKQLKDYKPVVQAMYNYATLLEPEDKAA